MENSSHNRLQLFIEELKFHLNALKQFPMDNHDYLDLGEVKEINHEALIREEKLPYDPIAESYQLLVTALNQCDLDKIKLGINEILKKYLKIITIDNQEIASHKFFERIKMVFRFSLLQSFPYSNFLWLYICRSLQNTALYLLENDFTAACKILLEYTADMGKTAAKEGLRTDILQHFLVMIEINALEKGLEDLAGEAKNHRHNLET